MEIVGKEVEIKTFFDNSLFHDIIWHPCGSNIAPHNDDFYHYMGYYHQGGEWKDDDYKLDNDKKLIVIGYFKAFCEKGINKECVVTESGDFVSKITVAMNSVSLTTKINVRRDVQGIDRDGQNYRDAFFTCLTSGNSEGTIICTEHFILIGEGTRLLHYSEDFDFFEIFDLPNNWNILDGISKDMHYESKVFDDTTYDNEDKDLNEIYEILNSRHKNLESGKKLILE